MVAKSAPRTESKVSKYYYRRSRLKGSETLRALGIGIVAGIAAFYVARIFFQKTPLISSGCRVRPKRNWSISGSQARKRGQARVHDVHALSP